MGGAAMKRDYSNLPFHPDADVFPLLEGKEFDELVVSIENQGCMEPITIYKGKILDGRNRYRAMLKLEWGEKKIRQRCLALDNLDSPLNYVIAKNIRRRHLTADQKQTALQALIAANPHKSDRQIAKDAGVSHP